MHKSKSLYFSIFIATAYRLALEETSEEEKNVLFIQ